MFANIYALPGIAAAIINLLLGVFIITRNPKHRQNQVFFFLTLCFIFIGIGEAILRSSTTQTEAFIGPILFYLGTLFLSVINLHFAVLFPEKKELSTNKKYGIFILYLISTLAFLIFLINYQPSDIINSPWGYRYPISIENITLLIATWLYTPSIAAFIVYVQKYRNTTDEIKRKQIRNVFLAIAFVALVTTFTNILPAIYNITIFPFATLSLSIYPIFITSSILQYSLFIYIPMSQAVLDKQQIQELNRDELEKEVTARTQALKQTNKELREEITHRKQTEQQLSNSLKEKNMLLQEIHHRVKNNLQIISSLLYLENNKEHPIISSNELRNRIKSMSLVHEKLYRSHNLTNIRLKDYTTDLIHQLYASYGINPDQIKYHIIEPSPITLDIDKSISCGLIINEIISNSLKHAFPNNKKGTIQLTMKTEKQHLKLTISDNGIGLPPDFNIDNTTTLGITLIKSLINQLNGTIEINTKNGATYTLTIPINNQNVEGESP